VYERYARARRFYYVLLRDGKTTGSVPRDVAMKSAYMLRQSKWRRSLVRRTNRPDSVPLVKPIFLLGLEGGGLTLLARTLVRNPAVVTVMGNSSHWTGLDEIGTQPSRMRVLPPELWGPKHRDDIEHPRLGSYHACIYACDELLPSYRRTPEDATPELAAAFKRILREHILVYAHDPRHARFLDKTQTYTVKAGFVNALLRDCEPRFVLVLRNPYTMVHRSIRRRMNTQSILPLPYEEKVRLAAQHWASSYRLALEDSAQIEHFMTLRFEDFLAAPAEKLQEICAFAELDFDPDMLPQAYHRLPFATWPGDEKWYPLRGDPWLDEVDEAEAEQIDRWCRPLAERFGYARAGVPVDRA
jgi:hypothetical protein